MRSAFGQTRSAIDGQMRAHLVKRARNLPNVHVRIWSNAARLTNWSNALRISHSNVAAVGLC